MASASDNLDAQLGLEDEVSTDPEFQAGLESIVGPLRERGASEEEIAEITRRAKEFYMSKRPQTTSTTSTTSPPLPLHPDEPYPAIQPPVFTASSQPEAPPPPPTTNPDEPSYPLSFTALAELIASGKPIPGIKQIPDKLNEEAPSESKVEKKRKPWEKDE